MEQKIEPCIYNNTFRVKRIATPSTNKDLKSHSRLMYKDLA